MNRRDFLGQILGMVAGAEFLALSDPPWQRVQLPYRMLFKDSGSGLYLQAPAVIAVEPKQRLGMVFTKKSGFGLDCLIREEVLAKGFTFVAEELLVKVPISPDKSILMDDRGRVISEVPFNSIVHLCPGDKFRVNHTVTADRDFTLEDLRTKRIVHA